jgi:hypothetical protein
MYHSSLSESVCNGINRDCPAPLITLSSAEQDQYGDVALYTNVSRHCLATYRRGKISIKKPRWLHRVFRKDALSLDAMDLLRFGRPTALGITGLSPASRPMPDKRSNAVIGRVLLSD